MGAVFVPLEAIPTPKSSPQRPKPSPAEISTSARNCCPEVETLKHDFGADRHSSAFLIPFEVIEVVLDTFQVLVANMIDDFHPNAIEIN